MIGQVHGPVILDLNTQQDLFAPAGAYPVVGADKVLDGLKRVFVAARRLRIPVISTRLRYLLAPSPGGMGLLGMNRNSQKLVCNPSTAGYGKMAATLLRKRKEMPMDCETSLPVEGFKVTQQYIFDLPSLNPFECPRLDRLMSEGEVETWVLIGGPLEWTLRTAVLGLLQRRQKVAVVSDAIGKWDPYEGDMALRQIESKNIEWLTAGALMERFNKPAPVQRLVEQVRPAGAPVRAHHASPVRAAAAVRKPQRAAGRATRVGKRAAQRGKLPSRSYRG